MALLGPRFSRSKGFRFLAQTSHDTTEADQSKDTPERGLETSVKDRGQSVLRPAFTVLFRKFIMGSHCIMKLQQKEGENGT